MASKIFYPPPRSPSSRDVDTARFWFMSHQVTIGFIPRAQTHIFNVEVNMCIANKFVFLMGDFNARTCNKDDFVDADAF